MSSLTVEERLERTLARVVEWLKFAEAKNAAILTLDAGAVAGLIGWMGRDHAAPSSIAPALQLALALLVLSALMALASFLPVVNIDWLRRRRQHSHADSLLFFGHIAGSKPETYLQSFREAAGDATVNPTRLESDYARQIVVNSEIAMAKYRLFTGAAWVSGAAVIIAAGAAAVHVLW